MEIYKNLSLEDLQGEVWKDIPNYEGLYQVSNLGRVKSLPRKHQLRTIIVAQHPTGYGYLSVKLHKDGKPKTIRVHKLVALCFLEEVKGLNEINHIDENKFNNRVDNLMRCDRLYNVNYGSRNISAAYSLRNRKDQSKTVLQIDENGNTIRVFRSAAEAGRFYECFPVAIQRVCTGQRNHYKNMFFKYK